MSDDPTRRTRIWRARDALQTADVLVFREDVGLLARLAISITLALLWKKEGALDDPGVPETPR